MTIELGFDYSCYVQPTITPQLAQALYAAGMRRCCLAIDTADNTFETARNLTDAGFKLDAYRELSGPSSYVQQTQSGIAGLNRLAKAGISCRIYWLTAEDTGVGTAHTPAGQRLVALPAVTAMAHLSAIGAPTAQPDIFLPAFHAAVEAAKGLRVGVYTGAWFWPTYANNDTSFSHLPLWHAGYDQNAILEPVNYGGWTMPFAHQYASPVSVAGSVGLDLDAWSVDDAPTPNPPTPTPTPPPVVPLSITSAGLSIRLSDGRVLQFEGTAE